MLATIKGYYDGNKIIIDEDIKLAIGQQVFITILEKLETEEKTIKDIDLKKYKGRGSKLMNYDAQEYVNNIRANDRI